MDSKSIQPQFHNPATLDPWLRHSDTDIARLLKLIALTSPHVVLYDNQAINNSGLQRLLEREDVKHFLKTEDPEKYVLFYTRHNSKNKVVGYFKVGKTFSNGKIGFESSESLLLPKEKCMNISYESRGVPVSWGKSKINPEVEKVLKRLKSEKKTDISNTYKVSTSKIMKMLTTKTGQDKMISTCEKCSDKTECHWGKYTKEKKVNRLNELYGTTEECSGKTEKC